MCSSDLDFEDTVRFIREVKLAGLHVFSYSPRPGTKAALLQQLPAQVIKRRAEMLRALDKELRAAFAASLVGTEQAVFMEERKDGLPHGIASNFQQVVLEGENVPRRGLVRAKIVRAEGTLCYGAVV